MHKEEGFFWRYDPAVKKESAEPPEPTWLLPTYLPNIQEAVEFNVDLFSDEELIHLVDQSYLTGTQYVFTFDIECYNNYFLIAFKSVNNSKIVYFELSETHILDTNKLSWVINNFCLIGFNSNAYDLVILTLALNGKTNQELKTESDNLIVEGIRPNAVYKTHKITKPILNHIDLIEVSPLFASLKIYGGRLHCNRMQDLPFDPNTILNSDQIAIIRWYCLNDLDNTEILYKSLESQLDLRRSMSMEYETDLMSKSDAQIAEAVIAYDLRKFDNTKLYAPNVEPGTMYRYTPPEFISYETPLMKWALGIVTESNFILSDSKKITMPDRIKKLRLKLGKTDYQMGIGGLHSCEEKVCHVSDNDYILKEYDVTSYYPYIILNLGLYPQHMGERLGNKFLDVYRGIVERRIEAKRTGNKTVADSLKITINGSFGKFGSPYSILYSPSLLIQVTITGQLSLLMLIESIELIGITVVSANTDGIVIKCPVNRQDELDTIIKGWQIKTKFELEETIYDGLYSRDVNNYIAVKKGKKSTKNKGIFKRPGLQKNPTNEICIMAIEDFLLKGTPIDQTIRACTDITKFVNVRTVNEGAVKLQSVSLPIHKCKEDLIKKAGYKQGLNNLWKLPNQEYISSLTLEEAYNSAKLKFNTTNSGVYLGKAIRWYYAKDETGVIVYAKTGNKVPRSEGAKPLMDMPTTFPLDVDYNWYITETLDIVRNMGYAN